MRIPWFKLTLALIIGIAFAFSFLQSIKITVNWWNGKLEAGPWEWLWIGLLPVWVFIFFRYYSIFRPGCRACDPSADNSSQPSRGPGAP